MEENGRPERPETNLEFDISCERLVECLLRLFQHNLVFLIHVDALNKILDFVFCERGNRSGSARFRCRRRSRDARGKGSPSSSYRHARGRRVMRRGLHPRKVHERLGQKGGKKEIKVPPTLTLYKWQGIGTASQLQSGQYPLCGPLSPQGLIPRSFHISFRK